MSDDDETPEELKTLDVADPEAVARNRQRRKHIEDQRGDFWRKTLADPVGRMVLWELLQSLGTFQTAFSCTPAGFPCPEQTWFLAGQKDFGQRLLETLSIHDRAAVWAMFDEHKAEWQKPKPQRRKKEEDYG